MRTTNVIAELLVGGVLTVIWLTILSMAAIGVDPVVNAIQQGSVPFGIAMLIVAYAFGVVFDRTWLRVLKPLNDAVKVTTPAGDTPTAVLWQRVYGCEDAVTYINHLQGRMRVARAAVCNFTATAVAAIILVAVRGDGLFSIAAALCLFGGAFVSIVSWVAFRSLTRSYYEALAAAASGAGDSGERADGPTRGSHFKGTFEIVEGIN